MSGRTTWVQGFITDPTGRHPSREVWFEFPRREMRRLARLGEGNAYRGLALLLTEWVLDGWWPEDSQGREPSGARAALTGRG